MFELRTCETESRKIEKDCVDENDVVSGGEWKLSNFVKQCISFA